MIVYRGEKGKGEGRGRGRVFGLVVYRERDRWGGLGRGV